MTIGEDIVLKITGPCTRCVMITLPQGDLRQDLGILRTVARYNQVHVGVYASVHHGGEIHRGDLIHLEFDCHSDYRDTFFLLILP
jgi:uncharacterized protein YcbX